MIGGKIGLTLGKKHRATATSVGATFEYSNTEGEYRYNS